MTTWDLKWQFGAFSYWTHESDGKCFAVKFGRLRFAWSIDPRDSESESDHA